MPRLGLTLTKQAINHVEDLQGKRNGMEAAFAWHHFSHAHNDLTTGNVYQVLMQRRWLNLRGLKPKRLPQRKQQLKRLPQKRTKNRREISLIN